MTRIIVPVVCLVLGVSFGAACVLPPVRMSAGGGGGAGDVVIRNSADEIRHYGRIADGQLRFGFTPMALAKDGARRRGDLSLGWSFDWQNAGRGRHDLRHGPYVEGVWFRRQAAIAEGQGWRLGPTVLLEMPMTAEDTEVRGFGIALGGLAEHVKTEHGRILGGGARGELGIGFSARAGLRRIDDGVYAYGVVSVEVRTPGLASWLPVPGRRAR